MTQAGTRQRLEQATAAYASSQANVQASRALIAAQRHQLDVLNGTKQQRAADLQGAKAVLTAARLKLGYTKITAPFDGIVGQRQVQPGDYVNIGSNLIAVVPLPNVYVIANYKETQLTHVRPGQRASVSVDTHPGLVLRARVDSIQSGTGSRFTLLPPENASGNFVKVVQRIPVKLVLEPGQNGHALLVPGMSVVPVIELR